MTKREILDQFKDINAVYNNPYMLDTLSSMIDELLKEDDFVGGKDGISMKKIISGKMYDTETAKAIRTVRHGEGPRDFRYYEETLYRKRTGEYFLAGKGGPMTHYAKSTGQNFWSGGEKIIPLSYEEAREWGEREMDAEDYEAAFGPVSEGDLAHLHISLPADVADRIRKAAASEGISVSECVARLFA